jgi:signal transduction histidine kinase/ligand-binding sensor domain-containing protein
VHPAAKRAVLLLMLFVCILPAFATVEDQANFSRDYVVKVWGPDDGLAEDSVTDIAQTPEGYLWVGTLFGSVLRFDGTRFVSYNSANTPQFSLKWGVPRLMVGREGTLWISMYDGGLTAWDKNGFHSILASTNRPDDLLWSAPGKVIFVYGGTNLMAGQKINEHWTWQTITPPDVLPQPRFCADAAGNIWYLCDSNQAGIWNGTASRKVRMDGQTINTLAADLQGRIWIGTGEELAVWQTDHFEIMTPTNGEPALNVQRIIPAGASNLWVEANGRMRRCIDRQWLAESETWNREMSARIPLSFLLGDRDGGFWTSAGDLGLIHVAANGDFSQLTTRDGLPSNTIRFAYEDQDGNIWTGYDRGGLVRIRRRLFENIGREEGLSDSLINTVSEDTHGAVWIGTHSGAVACYKNGVCTNLELPELAHAQDSCVAPDANGRIWIGALGVGLLNYQGGLAQTVATEKQLQGYPRLLLPARDGRVWVGTLWSIICVSNGNLVFEYTSPAEDVGGHPTALAEAADGTIWAGTLDGTLLHWNGSQFVPLTPPDKNSLGRIWALWPANDGSLWAGTEQGGLLHWVDGKFFRYTMRNGLPSDSIEEVMADTWGNLWLGTRAGIARIPGHAFVLAERDELLQLPVNIYGLTDGLLTIGSAIIYQPNCWRGPDGTLFFAMANSITSIDPGNIRPNTAPPEVALERMSADGKELFPVSNGAILTTAPMDNPEPPVITLAPGRGDLEFDYTGLSFRSPSRIRFKYRLDGLENSWNDAGSERKAVYRHVPPGQYVFHVMACNSDSIWSGDEALLAVSITPFIYQTVWFRGGMVLITVMVLSCAAAVGMRARMRRRVQQLERQREVERERARIAQDLHDDLGAGLTEIGLLGGLLQDVKAAASRKQEALDRIVQRCHDLVTGLDEIVWAVNPRNDSVNSLGSYLCRYAQRFLEPTMRCRLEMYIADHDYPLNSEQRHNLFLAFKEALTNVAKHSHATEAFIKISIKDARLLVEVEDDGRGLPEVVHPGGNGLTNLRNRMSHIGGECEIVGRPPHGTSVRLSLTLSAQRK